MNEPFYFYCVLPIALTLGLFFLWLLFKWILWNETNNSPTNESEYHTQAQAIADELIAIYTAARLNGGLSQWQKDRIAELQKRRAELTR